MNCYLCDAVFLASPSWRGLFVNEFSEVICGKCKNSFKKIAERGCVICSKTGEAICMDCRQWETTAFAGLIHAGQSLYHYNEAMKKFLHQYKFMQDVVLAEVFAGEINQALRKSQAVIVPVPMNSKKLKERTFPQVERLLDAAGINYRQFLEKSEEVQGTKTKMERLTTNTLFQWNGQKVPEKIVVVDDLYTTGTTLRHAAQVLRQHGAIEISVFTLIRG